MNQASEPMSEELSNPWKRPSELPKPAKGSVVLAAVLFGVASAAIALALWNEYAAILAWGLLIAGGFFLTRRHRLITALILIASVVGAVLPGSQMRGQRPRRLCSHGHHLPGNPRGYYPRGGGSGFPDLPWKH